MSDSEKKGASRRGFLTAAAGGLAAVAASAGKAEAAASQAPAPEIRAAGAIPFYGVHQAGIVTPQQKHTYLAALDITAANPAELVSLLKMWTEAAAAMMDGNTAKPLGKDLSQPADDSGEGLGLAASRLSITFGFGPSLFTDKDGQGRYGLGKKRPEALVDLPRFNGDQLQPARTGGDISIQACADDPQVAFHAVRQLVQMSYGAAQMRWAQTGFSSPPAKGTGRNLMGFKDGTARPTDMDKFVWVGAKGPAWMRGGSYQVVRRIRIALEHWDRTEVDFQEEVVGRHKYSGAPIGKKNEFDPVDLKAEDKDGNPVMPENSHVRLAHPGSNDNAQILRRGYSYNEGVNFTAERWPPWRQGMEYDAGLLFVAYQKDVRTGFIKIFEPMSKLDMMNQFTTHTGGGVFACPAGVKKGGYLGQALFEA
jgi:deferrochelatase/peroxidase EfeB